MIDKKLAKEIGATHFIGGAMYRFAMGQLQFFDDHLREWSGSTSPDNTLLGLQRIDFTEPEMVVEYVRITDSIFDLRPDFEAGELYYNCTGDYIAMVSESTLCAVWNNTPIYRKVEKPADWKEVAREFVRNSDYLSLDTTLHNLTSNTPDGDDWGAMADKETIKFIKKIEPLIK